MAKRRVAMILALLCLCFYCLPCCVQAVSTADAKGPIVTDAPCSLTIACRCDGHAFPDLPVRLYKIADVSAYFLYSLPVRFAEELV